MDVFNFLLLLFLCFFDKINVKVISRKRLRNGERYELLSRNQFFLFHPSQC